MMMQRYWVKIDDSVEGPYEAHLLKFVDGFKPDTWVSPDDLSNDEIWIKAQDISDLKHILGVVDRVEKADHPVQESVHELAEPAFEIEQGTLPQAAFEEPGQPAESVIHAFPEYQEISQPEVQEPSTEITADQGDIPVEMDTTTPLDTLSVTSLESEAQNLIEQTAQPETESEPAKEIEETDTPALTIEPAVHIDEDTAPFAKTALPSKKSAKYVRLPLLAAALMISIIGFLWYSENLRFNKGIFDPILDLLKNKKSETVQDPLIGVTLKNTFQDSKTPKTVKNESSKQQITAHSIVKKGSNLEIRKPSVEKASSKPKLLSDVENSLTIQTEADQSSETPAEPKIKKEKFILPGVPAPNMSTSKITTETSKSESNQEETDDNNPEGEKSKNKEKEFDAEEQYKQLEWLSQPGFGQ